MIEMRFSEMAKARYSVRRFDRERAVEAEKVERILEAARVAPSAHNLQSARILVLTGKKALERLDGCTPCRYGAPLAFVVSYDREKCWKRDWDGASAGMADACIAATQMVYAALEEGLGTTWVMGFHVPELREAYGIPNNLEPAAILVCGYPAKDVRPSSRHSVRHKIEDFVVFDGYETGREAEK